MPLDVTPVTRRFSYNGLRLPDPNPLWEPEEVRAHYSGAYPEIATATLEQSTEGSTLIYTFTRAVGHKG